MLSRGNVQDVVDCVSPAALRDDELWSHRIAAPAIRLATRTMPHLSEYGNGVGYAAVLCLAGSIASFIGMLHEILVPSVAADDGTDRGSLARKIVAMLGTALAPLLLAKDVADVSSLCDVLVWTSNNHSLVAPVLIWVWHANRHSQDHCRPLVVMCCRWIRSTSSGSNGGRPPGR